VQLALELLSFAFQGLVSLSKETVSELGQLHLEFFREGFTYTSALGVSPLLTPSQLFLVLLDQRLYGGLKFLHGALADLPDLVCLPLLLADLLGCEPGLLLLAELDLEPLRLLRDALIRLLRDLLHLAAQLFELGAQSLFVSDEVLNRGQLFFDPFGHLGADLVGLAGGVFLDSLEAYARFLSLLVSQLLEKF
jgi:hypothetical protein